jgi:hypothetical protein
MFLDMVLWFFSTLVKGPNWSNDSWEPLDKGPKQFGFYFRESPNSGIFYVLVEQNNLLKIPGWIFFTMFWSEISLSQYRVQ